MHHPLIQHIVFLVLLAAVAVVTGVRAADVPAPDGQSYVVTKIRFYPREGHAAQIKGGRFSGSLTSPTNDFEVLAPVKDAVPEKQWTEIDLSKNDRAYRYVKWEGPPNSYGNIAEIEFYAGDRKLTGTPFGTVGTKNDPNNDPKLAFDGDVTTFYTGIQHEGQYVGLDLGEAAQVAAPKVSVAAGSYPDAQTVAVSCATPGAVIRVSVEGQFEPRPYASPIKIAKSSILVAIASKPGLADSVAAIAAYRIGQAADPKEISSFHIGNSLTDTINAWMVPLAESAGKKYRYYRFTIPGAPTDWLWDHQGSGFGENRATQAFLAHAPINNLVTQPFFGHGRSIDNEADYSGRFFDAARKYTPTCQMWLYVQWPGEKFDDKWSKGKSELNGKTVEVGKPATTWQEAVANHVAYTERVMDKMNEDRAAEIKAGTCKPVRIIPGGLALARLKTEMDAGTAAGLTDFAKTVYAAPGDIHLSPKGQYLISLVHYACLFGESPEGKVSSLRSGLTDEQAKLFQKIAWETAKSYKYSGLQAKP
jgi:hypothetical protein